MIAAVLLTVALALLAAFQLALILGAPIGQFAWGGQHRVLSVGLRIGSAVGIVIHLFIALLALDRARIVDTCPDRFSAVCMGRLHLLRARHRPERHLAERTRR